MLIVKIDGMYKDIHDGSAFVDIIQGHIADIIKEGEYLCFRKADTFVLLNGELFLQRFFFSLTLVKAFCQHWNGLSLFDTSP